MGWLAGKKGTVQPDVCFASCMEITPNGNFPGPVKSESRSSPLPKSKMVVFARPAMATCGDCWTGGKQSPQPLLPGSPLRKTTSGLGRAWRQTTCSPSLQTWLWEEDPREGNHSQPEAGKCFPWTVEGADVGLLPSCSQQDGTSESKQNQSQCKGLLGISQ